MAAMISSSVSCCGSWPTPLAVAQEHRHGLDVAGIELQVGRIVAQQPQVRQHQVVCQVEPARGRIAQQRPQRLHVDVSISNSGSVKGITWARKA